MHNSFLILLRISLGLMLLMIGLVGIFIPIYEAWILVIISLPIISPASMKKTSYAFTRRHTDRKS